LSPITIINVAAVTMMQNPYLEQTKVSYLSTTYSIAQYFQMIITNAQNDIIKIISNDFIQQWFEKAEDETVENYEKQEIKTNAEKTIKV